MKARVLNRGLGARKTVKLTMSLFAVIGLGMLIGAAYLTVSTVDFLAVAEPAEGQVVDLEYRRSDDGGSYYPVVRFRSLDGGETTFTSRVGSSPSFFSRGDAVTVLYDPQSPQDARIDHFFQLWFGPIILGILGCVFGGIGLGYWGWKVRGVRLDAWLDENGERIRARIVDVGLDTHLSVNGQRPWRIRAQWQDPMAQSVYVFNSRALWFDPGPFLTDKHIEIVIDRRNPERYKFDLSPLPQEAS